MIDWLAVWKLASIAISGGAGVVGLVTEYKDDEGRLTRWGKLSLATIVLSTACALTAQMAENIQSQWADQRRRGDEEQYRDRTLEALDAMAGRVQIQSVVAQFSGSCKDQALRDLCRYTKEQKGDFAAGFRLSLSDVLNNEYLRFDLAPMFDGIENGDEKPNTWTIYADKDGLKLFFRTDVKHDSGINPFGEKKVHNGLYELCSLDPIAQAIELVGIKLVTRDHGDIDLDTSNLQTNWKGTSVMWKCDGGHVDAPS